MEIIYKIAAGSISAVIIITTLRSQNKEIALVLSLAACAVLALGGIKLFQTAVEYLDEMRGIAQIKSAELSPLIKVCGISALVQISATFCREAGESAVGKMVELCGGVAAVCAMLPLLNSVLKLIQDLLGG